MKTKTVLLARRALAFVLSFVMAIGGVPAQAFAATSKPLADGATFRQGDTIQFPEGAHFWDQVPTAPNRVNELVTATTECTVTWELAGQEGHVLFSPNVPVQSTAAGEDDVYTLINGTGTGTPNLLTVSGDGTEDAPYTFTLGWGTPLDIENTEVTFDPTEFTYTGARQVPSAKLTYQGTELEVDQGYTVVFPAEGDSINANDYTVTWTANTAPNNENGIYDLTGTKTATYTIKKAQLTGYWEPADDPLEYEVSEQGQGPVYKVNGATNVDGKLTADDIVTEYAKAGTEDWSTEKPTEAGIYVARASLADVPAAINYEFPTTGTTKYFTIKAAPQPVDPTLTVSIEDWYEGDEPSEPQVEIEPSDLEYVCKYKSKDDDSYPWSTEPPTAAGAYKLSVTTTATAEYNSVEKKVNFNILPKAQVELEVSIKGWTYGEEANTPTTKVTAPEGVEVDESTITYQYNTKNEETGKWNGWTTEVPTTPGKHSVKAILPEGATYKGKESKDKTFNIDYATATITVDDKEMTVGTSPEPELTATVEGEIDGDPITYYLKRNEGDAVTEEGKGYWINAYADADCTQIISYKADDEPTIIGNYKVTQVRARFSILPKQKITPTVTATIDDWREGEEASEPVISVDPEGVEYKVFYKPAGSGTWSETVPTEAGTYKMKVETTATEDYEQVVVTDEFEILPAKITPTVTASIDDWYEGDEASEPVISVDPEDVEYKVYYRPTEGTKWSSKVPTAAGSYKMGVRTTETDDYNVAEASADFNILEKQTLTVEIDEKWEYGDTEEHNPSAKLNDEDVEGATFEYQAADAEEGAEWSADQPTAVGSYKVRAKYNDLESEPAEFEITRKTISLATDVTVTLSTTSYEYDGIKHTPKATITVNATGEELERKVGYTSEIKDSNGNAQDIAKEPTEPGTYTVVLTANEEGKNISGNYLLVDANDTATYEIKPPVLTLTTSIDDWTYGEDQATPETKLEGEVVSEGVVYSYRAKADDEDPEAEFEYTEGLPTDAGKYELKATYEGKWDTYTATDDFEVKVATATIKIDAKEKDYGEEDPEFTSTVEGLIGEDTIEYTLKRNGGTEPDTYWINAFDSEDNNLYNGGAGTVKGNYLIKVQRAKLLIKAQTNVVVEAKDWTYGEDAVTPTVKIDDVVATDGFTLEYRTEDDEWSEEVPTKAGEYEVRAKVPSTSTTSAGVSDPVSFKINPRPVTLVSVTVDDKVYDGTTDATADWANAKFATDDVIGDDELTISGTVTFNGKDVYRKDGEVSGRWVYITDLALDGADKDNYVLAETGQKERVKAKITPRIVEFTGITADDKTYNGTDAAKINIPDNPFGDKLVLGDELTIEGLEGKFEDANVGYDKKVKLNTAEDAVVLGGKDAGNYELQKANCQDETTADIYYAEATITADKQEKTYGDADPTLTAVVTGLVEGESEDLIKYKLTRENGTNVGEYEIKCDYEFFQGNYVVNYVKNYLTITQKEAKVKAENKTKAFGEADPELTAKVTGTINGDTLSYTLTRDWVGTEDGEKVGSYYIRATGDENQNNYHVTFENGVLTIDPKDVTVTADDLTITFGDEAPTYTATSNVDGFDAYKLSCDYKQGDNAGTYDIKVENTDTSGNYNVTTKDGKLTVKAKDVTVTAKDATITYGDEAPVYEATASVDGFDAYQVSCAYTKGDNIGTYDITVTSTDTTGNYNVTVENATLTVNPAKVTITPTDAEKQFNRDDPTLKATVDGLVNGDPESVIKYKLSRATGENVGTYKISVEADAEQGNYVVKCETGTFTITRKLVSIVIDNKAKVYGEPDPELTATVYGLVAGDQISYKLTREKEGMQSGEQVGEYDINAFIFDMKQGNYEIAGVSKGKLTINEKAATITAKDEQITYGDKLPDFTATVEGTLNGDTLTYTVKAVYEDSDLSSSGNLKVGEYPIVVECETTQGNYAVGTTAGKLTVAPKTVTFDGITASDKVYDGTVDAELSVDNATINGAIDGDDFKVVDAKGEFEDKDAGLKKNVEIQEVELDGTDADNYKVDLYNSQYRTKASITRKAVKVTPADNQKIYGDKDPFINVTVEGILDGDTIVYSRTRDEGEDVGKYTIRTDGVEQQGNYQVEFGTATFTITKREVTVSGITAKNKTYDGTTKATLVFDGVKFGNIVKGDELGVTAKGVFASKNVGTRQVDISNLKLTGSSAKNYVLAKDGNQTSTTAKITKATLTVTAKDKTIKFGSAPKNAGVTYDGFVNGETKSVLTGKLAYDYGGYEKGSYAGTYKITPSGLKSSNYKIKYKKGKLIVTAPKTVGDSYIVHARDLGDMAAAYNGGIAGTTGEGRRIEAVGLSLSLDNQPYAGGIEYRSHLRNIDWLKSWQRDGEFSGTKGEGRRLEAVQIRLYGKMAKYYDVYYRLHVRNYGWMGWAKNGAKAGTVHENRRAEAIQVVVLKKGSKAPGANYKGASTTFAAAFTTGNPIL